MSRRSEMQVDVIAELEAMGLTAEGSLGRVQGRSGYSRDVYFEDVRVGFAGRLRIFGETFVTVNFGNAESERFDTPGDAISAVADAYADVRGSDTVPPPLSLGASVAPSQPFSPPARGRPSTEDIQAVKEFLLTTARIYVLEDKMDVARGFADAATRLGATAADIVGVMFGTD